MEGGSKWVCGCGDWVRVSAKAKGERERPPNRSSELRRGSHVGVSSRLVSPPRVLCRFIWSIVHVRLCADSRVASESAVRMIKDDRKRRSWMISFGGDDPCF